MKIIILLITIAFSFITCSDKLDVAPLSRSISSTFYKDAKDIDVAVNGIYSALQRKGQYGQSIPFLTEVRSDNSEETDAGASGRIFSDMDLFLETASNSVLNDMWVDSYRGINNANAVIDRINSIEMDAVTKKNRKGEALFLRSLMYFNLVRIFGDVPLVLKETQDPFDSFGEGRTAIGTIYTQIIKDLTTASTSLPLTPTVTGKATSGAAYALLGKVQLTLKKYTEALAALDKVTGYTLVPDYIDIFGAENENNVESIFEVQYNSGTGSIFKDGEGSPYSNQFGPAGKSGKNIVKEGQTLGSNRPTLDLRDSYDEDDIRKDISVGIVSDTITEDSITEIIFTYYPKKIVGAARSEFESDVNAIVLRYADVLLMRAEALNELDRTSEALGPINEIRNRAGLPDLTITDKEEFRLAVENERRWELAFENHRWFDLLRTDRAIGVMSSHTTKSGGTPVQLTITPGNLLYSIPQDQIDINSALIQNP